MVTTGRATNSTSPRVRPHAGRGRLASALARSKSGEGAFRRAQTRGDAPPPRLLLSPKAPLRIPPPPPPGGRGGKGAGRRIPPSPCQFKRKMHLARPSGRRALDPRWGFGPHRGAGGHGMDGKVKYIFPVLITAIIVFVVSGVVTWTNIGFRFDFVTRWLSAFIVGWPVAAVTAFVAIPFVRRMTQALVTLIDRPA